MPKQLTVNKETGFLESANSSVTFDASKKTHFLRIALKYVQEEKKIPSLLSLCQSIGISLRTFERHIGADPAFKDRFREVLLIGQDILTEVMFDRAKTPGGFMDRAMWLRRHFPEYWNPDHKIQISSGPPASKKLLENIDEYIEAEIVDEKG